MGKGSTLRHPAPGMPSMAFAFVFHYQSKNFFHYGTFNVYLHIYISFSFKRPPIKVEAEKYPMGYFSCSAQLGCKQRGLFAE